MSDEKDKSTKDTPKKAWYKVWYEWLTYKRLTLLFSFLLTVSTCTYVFVSLMQWYTIRTQFTLGERPWVIVQNANYKDFKVGDKPIAVIVFINTGRTPARNVRTIGHIALRYEPAPNPIPYNSPNCYDSNSVIGPNNVMSLLLQTNGPLLNEEDLKAVNEKKLRLYIWGCVDYDDIFSNHYKTNFLLVNKPGTDNFDFCKYGNEVE